MMSVHECAHKIFSELEVVQRLICQRDAGLQCINHWTTHIGMKGSEQGAVTPISTVLRVTTGDCDPDVGVAYRISMYSGHTVTMDFATVTGSTLAVQQWGHEVTERFTDCDPSHNSSIVRRV